MIYLWYIYLHEWLMFMVNVAIYPSPMDAMGLAFQSKGCSFGVSQVGVLFHNL